MSEAAVELAGTNVLDDIGKSAWAAYPEYSDSGIEWLGYVPVGWKVKQLRYLGRAILGLTYSPENVVDEGQGTLVLRSSNVFHGKIKLEDNVYVSSEIPKKLITQVGDILICSRNGSRALIGKNARIDEGSAGVTFGAFMTIFRSSPSDYLYYVLNSTLFEYQSGAFLTSTINQLTVNNLYSFKVPVPPVEEQHAISTFLDRETAYIDALIAKKQQLIDLLQEKRTALISQAVTKGLDPGVPMKDSTVEWLGEIPAHWEVYKFSHVGKLQGGFAFKSELFGSEGVAVVRMNNLKRGILNLEDASRIPEEEALQDFTLREDDLVWGMSGSIGVTGSLGNFARVRGQDLPAQLNQRVGRFVVNIRKFSIDFLEYVVSADAFYEQILLMVTGTAQYNVSSNQVQSTKISLPPLDEQAAIVTHLKNEVSHIDAVISKVESAIAGLVEYRSALISAAVTGKIDVRQGG